MADHNLCDPDDDFCFRCTDPLSNHMYSHNNQAAYNNYVVCVCTSDFVSDLTYQAEFMDTKIIETQHG